VEQSGAANRDFAGFEAASAASLSASAMPHARRSFLARRSSSVGGVGDERAESLAAIDEALALEFLVTAQDSDDADEEVLRDGCERWQSPCRRVSRPS
jgi:hypothetical protein